MSTTMRWLHRIHLAITVLLVLSLWAQWHTGDVRPVTAFLVGALVTQQLGRLG